MASEPNRRQEVSDTVEMSPIENSSGNSALEASSSCTPIDIPEPPPGPSDAPIPTTTTQFQSTDSSENADTQPSTSDAVPNTVKGKRSTAEADKEEIENKDKEDKKDSLEINLTSSALTSQNVCQITLLLPTNARHPYRIDDKYLNKRNISTPALTEDGKPNPFSISIYTLKELILREWRPEWDAAPASPSSIRLIFFGKLLDDKSQLSEYNFSHDSPNIVHMTIRPPEIEEEEGTKGTKSTPGNTESSGCGCCVVS